MTSAPGPARDPHVYHHDVPGYGRYSIASIKVVAKRDYDALLARLAACAERGETLETELGRAATLARRLLEMIDPHDFSDVLGPEGQLEGDYRAALIAEDIRGWAALAGAAPEPEQADA